MDGSVQRFLTEFSSKKANAAALAQERSWKDFTLQLCEHGSVRHRSVPPDFDKVYLDVLDERDNTTEDQILEAKVATGGYLRNWLHELDDAIQGGMYNQLDSTFVCHVLSAGVEYNSFPKFQTALKDSWGSQGKSVFTLAKNIPGPVPIHVLAYIILMIAPASAARCEDMETTSNAGLDQFKAVIKGNGTGINKAPSSEKVFFSMNNPDYIQSVSEADKKKVSSRPISPSCFYSFTNTQISGIIFRKNKSRYPPYYFLMQGFLFTK